MRRTSHQHPATRSTLVHTLAVALAVLGPVLGLPAMAQESPDTKTLEDYRMQGLHAAMQTKGALGGELLKAMEAGGPENAVAFCNTRALPITREMSSQLRMDVSRVSDRPRNPANAANDEERAIIAAFKETLAQGRQPAPAVREHDDTVLGYYPIVTNAMCLKCHGTKGDDISPATQAVIDDKYPDDQATGYGEKELRGLFVVEMQRGQDAASATDPGSS